MGTDYLTELLKELDRIRQDVLTLSLETALQGRGRLRDAVRLMDEEIADLRRRIKIINEADQK